MAAEKQLSLVIPCFNEEKSIPELVSRAGEMLARIPGEVVFIDNGSTDSTAMVLKKSIAGRRGMRIVSLKQNRGYGAGIKAGLAASRYDFVGWTHADLEVPFSAVEDSFRAILRSSNMGSGAVVKGRRFGRPMRKNLVTSLMTFVTLGLLKKWMPDSNAVPVIFSRKLLWLVDNAPDEFDFELYVYWRARVSGLSVQRVPFMSKQRLHGASSWESSVFAPLRLGLHLIRSIREFPERAER